MATLRTAAIVVLVTACSAKPPASDGTSDEPDPQPESPPPGATAGSSGSSGNGAAGGTAVPGDRRDGSTMAAEATSTVAETDGGAWNDKYLMMAGIPLRCSKKIAGSGDAPLIDDFEDGNMAIPANEGRGGLWNNWSDGTGMTIFGIADDALRPPSTKALHFQGITHTGWGGGVGGNFISKACFDASAYAGIRFWGKGVGTVRVGLMTYETMDSQYGGRCVVGCIPHSKDVTLTAEWTSYDVKWQEVKQLDMGQAAPFYASEIMSISFASAGLKDWDFWLDDPSFFVK